MPKPSEYMLKYHLSGLTHALGLPLDTYLSVSFIPDTDERWTTKDFDTLVEVLGGSVRRTYTPDYQKMELKSYSVQHVDYTVRDDEFRASVAIHGPTRVTKLEEAA